jgi:hypothetical protein
MILKLPQGFFSARLQNFSRILQLRVNSALQNARVCDPSRLGGKTFHVEVTKDKENFCLACELHKYCEHRSND